MTAVDITIHATFLPHDDPEASLAFFRDTLGFEVRNDVGYGGMRWITVGPADWPRHVDFRASRSSLSSIRHTGSM
jgi:catechol 2,3-dioxygenase-like lactoylglutathione lyase family enzyme